MTPVVQDLLTTFDRLTDSERLDLASEIAVPISAIETLRSDEILAVRTLAKVS
jgi:hypothetical protein